MGKWCVTLAIGMFLAIPAVAQQRSTVTGDPAGEGGASATKVESPAARSSSNLPASPRSTPFPGPAKATSDDEPGVVVPRYEIALMYDYLKFQPGYGFQHVDNHGASGSITYNANKWLGLNADVGGYYFNYHVPVSGAKTTGGWTTYLFGPRINLARTSHAVPFLEGMAGLARVPSELTGGRAQNVLALAAGGGLDVVITRNVAWRLFQADYLMTKADGPFLNSAGRQDNFRVGTGLVMRWGIPNPPPPPNRTPVAACSVSPASVFAGSNDAVAVHVNASDPDNDTLTYSYTATGGTVEGTGPDARWNSSGLSAGNYTVNAKVDDGKGGTATCSADIAVQAKPNQAPTISCATDRSPILPGERTGITATASDPDNDPLTYSYTASAGQIVGEGPKVQFDSTGLQAGSYTVKCAVSDGKGGTADASTTVDVEQPPPPPQATKVGDCDYGKPGSSRVDNVCKRVLDDVALRLKNDPNAKLVITGYADPREPRAAKLADTRADLARKFLGEKGIDASRITTRTGTASKEKGAEKDNRRVEFIFVPEGATY
ncbi:MAG: hypothetical protein NVS9B4_04600 [Candidatus Acidiferrum sp.]